MVITIENLIETMKIKSPEEKSNQFVKIVLEAIALSHDNVLMNDLMLDVINRNALLNKQLELQLVEIKRLSVTDQLTGLYNRRKFLDAFENEIGRLKRYKHPFTLIMFDIDHFKSVNDNYGHDVGDFVLKKLASVVGGRLRKSDTFSRWGGEEFMILAHEMDIDKAKVLAEGIRSIIESTDFSPVPRLTCSFGVVTCNDAAKCEMENLTRQVDKVLYKAKNTGRNKVVVHEVDTISN